MEQLKSLLEIGIDSWKSMLIQTLLLMGITSIILWGVYVILVKITAPKTKLHKDLFLRLQFLWGLFIVFILFNVYWFYLIKLNGVHQFKWNIPSFYKSISPQIINYLFGIGLFIYSSKRYHSLFKK